MTYSDPYDLLFSSDSEVEEAVKQIVVADKGSKAQHASVSVSVNGVSANGVDTGADITIMGSKLFAQVAAAARLRKNFRKLDKMPHTHVREPFHLDGCIDSDISFDERTMKIAIKFVKMDAQDQVLLSEGVC